MQFLKRLMNPFARKKADHELEEEVRFHLEKQIEINVAAGMSLAEARRHALIEFGGVQKTKEDVREQRWTNAAGVLLQDTRYAFRMFRKSPGFTAIAVLTLALGIGMNTAIFSLIDAVLFSALPVSHPEELVVLRWHAHHQPKLHSHSSYGDCAQKRQGDDGYGCSLSLPFLNAVRSQSNLFSGLAAFSGAPRLDLSGNGAATIVNNAQLVSGDFFTTLGVKTVAGRAFSPGDDTPKAESSVMLSYGYWKSAFGGSPDAVGRTIRLNGLPFIIIGIAEPGFTGLTPGRQNDLWLPLSARARLSQRWTPKEDDGGSWWLVVVGRPKPGISAKQAEAALSLLFRNETLHEQKPLFTAADAPGVNLLPAQQGLDGGRTRVLQPLYVLMLAVALVLLIACANIAGLLLARAAGRSREIAVRLVLGAKRARLVSQLLVESLLLSVMGGALGLVLALWSARGLMVLANNNASFTPHLDWRVLAFTAATAILTGLFFGLIPAFRSLRIDLTPALKAGAGTSAATASGTKWYSLGNFLVVAQVSLAVVALVTAGLLVRTLSNLKNVNLGFDTRNVLVFGLDPALAGYKGPQIDALNRDLQEQFAALPGVTSVSYSWAALLAGSSWDTDIHLPGTSENEKQDSDYMPVGPRFFQTMGIPLKAGRDFSAADFAAAAVRSSRPPGAPADPTAAPTTVIVNETFVRRFFPHANPLGQHIEELLPDDPKDPRGPGWEIVGVAGDAKYDSLRREISPTMYAANAGNASFAVRTAGDPLQLVPVIRDLVNRKDNNLAMFRIATESKQIDSLVSVEQLVARLATFFGLLAVVLACIGLYGLLSYEVTQRTREIGIRMAIGAQRSNVIRLVVVQGIMLAAVGAVVGSGASLGVTRLLKTALYGVTPGDPITLAFCAALLLVVAMAACYLPARRATRVDPLVALRYE
jgi:macrolide transport system ATP-binding/permease protein